MPALERVMMRTTRGSGAPVRSADAIRARFSTSSSPSSMERSLGISHPLEFQPLDPVHVHAFEADEPGRAFAAGRMQIAFVIEVGGARRELVGSQRLRLSRPLGAGGRDQR